MKLSKWSKIEILSVVSIIVSLASGVVSLGGVASADSATTSNTQPSSSIARSVVHDDQLKAMASVLNLTTAQIQIHLKTHDLQQVVADTGLTGSTYHQKVQTQLESELQAQGYSQTQIDSAAQHYQQRSGR
jgi:hypothetical protein